MAVNSNSQNVTNSRISHRVRPLYAVTMSMLLVLLFGTHSTQAINMVDGCLPYDDSPPKTCLYGGFSGTCSRYICYKGLNESCNRFEENETCRIGLTCSCGKCQNCDETNCYTQLCPLPRYVKRYRHNLLTYGSK